jgi:hypothetical protein
LDRTSALCLPPRLAAAVFVFGLLAAEFRIKAGAIRTSDQPTPTATAAPAPWCTAHAAHRWAPPHVHLCSICIYDRFVFSASSSGAVSRRRSAEASSSAGSMAPVPTRPRKRWPPSRSAHGSGRLTSRCLPARLRPWWWGWPWTGDPDRVRSSSIPPSPHTCCPPGHHHLPVRPPAHGTRSRPHPCRDDSHGQTRPNGREEPAAIGKSFKYNIWGKKTNAPTAEVQKSLRHLRLRGELGSSSG